MLLDLIRSGARPSSSCSRMMFRFLFVLLSEKMQECLRAGAAIRLMLERDIKPRDIMTRKAFENASELRFVVLFPKRRARKARAG